MGAPAKDIPTILGEAIELNSPAEREAYLQQICHGDAALRRRIDQLLQDHAQAGDFLERPLPATLLFSSPAIEGPGQTIGPYKLLEQIGEGAFGIVFMAEQVRPVRRMVALKILKPGMDTRQVVARFEAERQALALMDDSHIARVLDAGTAGSGRPYFVMELVKGIPITSFCDERRLTTRDRLKLFIDVCHAIQHAHQKGIIHRDIKPSNILVTLHDGTPTVKVIDFGIAKALGQQLTDKTLFTGFAQLIGTPIYMSPEQAGWSAIDVDTRSDVYSLGVVLYELLTGTTPFEKETLLKAGCDELRRIIRENEPPRPSVRISTMKIDARSTIADRQQLDPLKLSRFMQGELDWIVMTALEKERSRRYQAASDLADDLERYLNGNPVEACPPSVLYRLKKAARRNRTVLSATGFAVVALLAGTAVSVWQAIEATNARELADERLVLANERLQRETKALQDSLAERKRAEEQRQLAEANFQKAIDAADRLLLHISHDALRDVPQMDGVSQKIMIEAYEFYKSLLQQKPDDSQLRHRVARTALYVDRLNDSNELFRQLANEQPHNADLHVDLAYSYVRLGWQNEHDPALQERYFRQGHDLLVPFAANRAVHSDLALACRNLGGLLCRQHRFDESRQMFDEAMRLCETGAVAPIRVAQVYEGYAALLEALGRSTEAIAVEGRALEVRRKSVRESPDQIQPQSEYADGCRSLANMLSRGGRDEDAVKYLIEATEISRRLVRDFPSSAGYKKQLWGVQGDLVHLYARLKRPQDALQVISQLTPRTFQDYAHRAFLYSFTEKTAEQISDLEKLVQLVPEYCESWTALGISRLQIGDDDRAVEDFDRALATDTLGPGGSDADSNAYLRFVLNRVEGRIAQDPSAHIRTVLLRVRARLQLELERREPKSSTGSEDASPAIAELPDGRPN